MTISDSPVDPAHAGDFRQFKPANESRAFRERAESAAGDFRQFNNMSAVHGLGWVLLGGLVAGAADLTFAFVFYGLKGATPIDILHAIASGILGRQSFQMGAASAALGAVCHFLISISAAFIYYLVSLRVGFLTRKVVIAGAIFGVLMYLAMHFIVVPLSAAKQGPLKIGNVIGELCSHIFLFGIVIAYAVSRARGRLAAQPA